MIICTRQLGKELGGSCEKQMVDHARMYFFKTLYSVSSLLFFLSLLQNIYNKISEEINSFLFSFFSFFLCFCHINDESQESN